MTEDFSRKVIINQTYCYSTNRALCQTSCEKVRKHREELIKFAKSLRNVEPDARSSFSILAHGSNQCIVLINCWTLFWWPIGQNLLFLRCFLQYDRLYVENEIYLYNEIEQRVERMIIGKKEVEVGTWSKCSITFITFQQKAIKEQTKIALQMNGTPRGRTSRLKGRTESRQEQKVLEWFFSFLTINPVTLSLYAVEKFF